MVTLVQQQTIPTRGNRGQKEQEQSNGDVVAESEAQDRQVEVAQPAKDTAVTVAGNGSLAGSSTQCSDVDDDDDEDETEDEWVPDLPVPAVLQHHQQVSTADGNVVLPNADASNFGDVCIKNSANVHLGSKTFYKGPVTIKQFVYTNPLTSALENDAVKCDIGHASNINIANASDLSNAEADAYDNSFLAKHPDLHKVVKWLWTWRCAAFLCVLALILVTTVVVASIYVAHNTATPPALVFPEIPDSSLGGVKVKNVRFVERNEWGAQPPTEQLTKMKLPVPYVIISHTVTDFCSTQSQCTFHVRFAQTFHIESRKWSDIGYNFLVGGDGLVYVGRSWDYMGAHSFGFNNISIGISFIGTFNSVKPPKNQLYAAQRVIELGVEGGKIAPDYKLLGHRQISGTLSPGDALYSVIKTWPHWSPKP